MKSATDLLDAFPATHPVIDRLREDLGIDFFLCERQRCGRTNKYQWQLLQSSGEHGSKSYTELLELLQPIGAKAAPSVLGTPGLERLVVPIPWNDTDLLAISKSQGTYGEDQIRLARLVAQNVSLEHRMETHDRFADQFAAQISRDFEELTFLQRMMESLDVAAADTEFSDVLDSILAELRPAIEAQSIVFVANIDPESTSTDLEPFVRNRTVCIGEDYGFDWVQLLNTQNHDFSTAPLVRNRLELASFPMVRQFVAVEIKNRTRCFGWLIAANRANSFIGSLDGTPSEAEFGTYEASLLSSAASVMASYGLNRELLNRREKLLLDVVSCLVSAIDAKDDYTRGHSIRVAQFGRCIAEQLGWSKKRCQHIYMAGLLHDVGKIGVPDAILNKEGPLDDDEFQQIKQHPDHGWAILHQLKELDHILPGIVHHHEEFAGTGYPDKLSRLDIPVEGRVLAVADAYDAIVSDRAYRKGRPHEEAVDILRHGAGTQWDPEIIEAFCQAADRIGALSSSYRHEPPPVRTGPISSRG